MPKTFEERIGEINGKKTEISGFMQRYVDEGKTLPPAVVNLLDIGLNAFDKNIEILNKARTKRDEGLAHKPENVGKPK